MASGVRVGVAVGAGTSVFVGSGVDVGDDVAAMVLVAVGVGS